KTGFHVIKRPKYNGSTSFNINNLSYAAVTPGANYAPWYGDKDFQKIYVQAKKNTLVDKYRCYELWELTKKAAQLFPDGHFLEVGVWRGGTAAVIGHQLAKLGSKVKFYLADTFEGVQKSSKEDTFYNDGEHADTDQSVVQSLLANVYQNYHI